jgi:hypothetical protein
MVSEFPSGYSHGLERVSIGFLFICPYPWSWSYHWVFPWPQTSCPSDLALLVPNAETRSLSVAVDKLAPWLLSAFFWSRLALLSVLACACFKTAASVSFLWKCHGFACSRAQARATPTFQAWMSHSIALRCLTVLWLTPVFSSFRARLVSPLDTVAVRVCHGFLALCGFHGLLWTCGCSLAPA